MAKPKKKYSNFLKREISYIKELLEIKKIEDIDKTVLKRLKEKLKDLKDSRMKHKIIYKLWDVIICVIVSSFADNNTWEDIHNFIVDNYKWFKSFLQMTGGIPTADSIERIIGIIDTNELNQLLSDFFVTLVVEKVNEMNLMSFDGRVNNGSKRQETIFNKKVAPLNCLNVYSNKIGYCICTVPIEEKTNEIPTVEKLVKGMDLNGVIALWDALNTQTKNIEAVIDAGGDYVVPIKGNQPTFYQDLIDYFDEERCDEIIAGNSQSAYKTYIEKSHGSVIIYECFQTSDINWYSDLNSWKGLQTFGLIRKTIVSKQKVKNTRKKSNKSEIVKEVTTVENRYYISSRMVNIEEFDLATRGEWAIENKVHWHLDFTFCQDNNSTLNKNALLNLEIIHKFVLAILERVKSRYKMSLRSIRKHISNNIEEFFPELICNLIVSK